MVAAALIGLWSLSFVSCGGGGGGLSSASGGTTAATNEVAVVVDSGPDPTQNPTANTLYTTVTICVPGSATECQTIDHIQVDTGSEGLRILAPVLTLSLPVAQATDGNSLMECTQFVGAYSWGPIASADIQVAGEKASAVPVQVMGGSAFVVPTACANVGKAGRTRLPRSAPTESSASECSRKIAERVARPPTLETPSIIPARLLRAMG